jgi:hypothetical protein
VVERRWEMPCQQQGVTPIAHSLVAPRKGCEGGFLLWTGDGWQQAPDNRKVGQRLVIHYDLLVV